MSTTNTSLVAAQRLCPVSCIKLEPADPQGVARGVLLRCSFVTHQTFGHRASIRRRREGGRLYLAFPKGQRTQSGRWIPDSWPMGESVREAIELQVLGAAREMGLCIDAREPDAS